ncbi:MAG TPA: hypothetical protein VFN51_01770 [Candidatus Saccharimonadales bacterium]|nr:hypothetical protein [Candidatus Saccharimonadales bacterium]
MEDYDPAYYDRFEHFVSEEIATDEATIGEIDTSLKLDPCKDCPLFDFPLEQAVRVWRGVGAIAGREGVRVSITYETSDGRQSSEITLGYHNKSSIGSKRLAKIYEEAARRTIDCKGPKTTFRYLGPLAVKKCPALTGRKRPKPNFIIK